MYAQTKHVQTQYNVLHGTAFACKLEILTWLLKRSAEAVQSNLNTMRPTAPSSSAVAVASVGVPVTIKVQQRH